MTSLRLGSLVQSLPRAGGRPRRPDALRAGTLAACVVALALFGAWAVLIAYPTDTAALVTRFSPEVVQLRQMEDSSGQRLAHEAFLALLGLGGLLAMWLWKKGRRAIGRRMRTVTETLRSVARHSAWPLWGVTVAYGLARLPDTAYALAFVLALPFLPLLARLRPHRGWRLLAALGIAAYAAFAILPGFLAPLRIPPPPELLSLYGSHYNAVMGGAADRLARGSQIFRDTFPRYGLLPATLLAGLERQAGVLDFAGHVRLVQAAQALFVLIALAAHAAWARGRLWRMWIALALVIPWSTTYISNIWTPNLTAWRFLGFAVASAVLIALRRRSGSRVALRLGALSAVCLLINLETGIAITAGVLIYGLAGLEPRSPGTVLAAMLRFLAGGVLIGAGFVIAFRLLLGAWPVPEDAGQLVQTISLHALGGFGGLGFYVAPVALWILLHSAYVAVRGAVLWLRGPLAPAWRVRTALATMILVWFAYYANRPHPLNLEHQLFLYSFLVYDLLAPLARLARAQRRRRPIVGLVALLAALVLIPAASDLQRHMGMHLRSFLADPGPSAELSGVHVAPAWAQELKAQAAYLVGDAARDAAYFSANPYLLSLLTGRTAALGIADPFDDAITPQEFDRLVERTQALAPAVLLFDAPGNVTAGPELQRHFYARFKARLTVAYHRAGEAQGWEIWQRIAAADGSPGASAPARP